MKIQPAACHAQAGGPLRIQNAIKPKHSMNPIQYHNDHILILGIGCTLLRDEGIGVKIVHALNARYTFADNVELLDGATLGVNLLGYMSQADHLIVVDAIRHGGGARRTLPSLRR